MDINEFTPQTGMDVYGSDGEKVGQIDAVERDYFVVSKGWFFPKDHYIPLSAVASTEDNAVYLNVTRDGALEQNWGEQPQGTHDDVSLGADPAGLNFNESTRIEEPGTSSVTDADFGETQVNDATYGETGFDDQTYPEGTVHEDGSVHADTLEVREEDLQATTREVDRGSVRVEKHVVEEQQALDVPLTEEEVHVHRRAVDRPTDSIDFEDTTIEVPVKGEEVDVSKTARVVEEIDIDKTARERVETVSDTVRHEEVEIDTDDLDDDIDRSRLNNDDRNRG